MKIPNFKIAYKLVSFAIGFLILSLVTGVCPLFVSLVFAHCDTLDGPVVNAARKALETGNVDFVLIWVQKKDETEIKKIFEKTVAVRKVSREAKDMADMYFFETLVRIHRTGEGASYTGLKPSGAVEPAIAAADLAVENESVDNLAKEVSEAVSGGIHKRFNNVIEKKKHINESVEAGREYVESYVEFIHYVEKLHLDAAGKSAAHGEPEAESGEEHHH